MYPYAAGGTGLAATLPLWVQEGGREKMLERLKDPAIARARPHGDRNQDRRLGKPADGGDLRRHPGGGVPRDFDQSIVGKRISEIAEERKADPWETYFSAADRQRRPHRRAVSHDERGGRRHRTASRRSSRSAPTRRRCAPKAFCRAGSPHPRSYGTFPRVLGKYVRDDKLMTLPGRRAAHDRRGRRADGHARSRADSRSLPGRPRRLQSGHGEGQRHLRAAASVSDRHRVRGRQRRAGARSEGAHRRAAGPSACTGRREQP